MFLLIEVGIHKNDTGQTPPDTALTIHKTKSWLSTRHPTLNVYAKIHARQAYPSTFCERLADGRVHMGYGRKDAQHDEEFLYITIGTDGSIEIKRDIYCTLPLFYAQYGDIFVVSNEYSEVVKRIPRLTLNHKNLCQNLLSITPIKQYTLWNEVRVLAERQTLLFKKGMPVITPDAPPRNWTFSTELAPTDPRAFPTIIKDRFTRFYETRLRVNTVGFELSGGLDSAFLPLFLSAQRYDVHGFAGTLIQPSSEDAAYQHQKVNELEARASLSSMRVHLDPQKHYPLCDVLRAGKPRPFDHTYDLYGGATGEIIDYFQGQDVTVVVTGAGGDQLLEHRPHPSLTIPNTGTTGMPRPEFVTGLCQPPAETQDEYAVPPTLLSTTIGYENVSQANNYISRGTWPVTPFYDVQLFNFCQALPVQFRANKNIYRAYFEAHSFPESLYRGHNEDFGTFFNMCLLSGIYDPLVLQLAKDSVTAKLGYVDVQKLVNLFFAIRNSVADPGGLFSIFTWIEVEINLQYTPNYSY